MFLNSLLWDLYRFHARFSGNFSFLQSDKTVILIGLEILKGRKLTASKVFLLKSAASFLTSHCTVVSITSLGCYIYFQK